MTKLPPLAQDLISPGDESVRVQEPWRARVFALYLPQFYPTPENDEWWGAGFTEWTNVASARPLFRGHRQPHLPGELGFYDLRLPETRGAQAVLARDHGVEAFIVWHYWFAGRRLLDRPFREILESGRPDFPFCLGWANHSWTGIWIGADDRMLVEQTYPGTDDIEAHVAALLPAFADHRYVTIDGAPMLYIFRPKVVPGGAKYWDCWREVAVRQGLPGLHLVGVAAPDEEPGSLGMDATVSNWVPERRRSSLARAIAARLVPSIKARLQGPTVYDYKWYEEHSVSQTIGRRATGWEYACVMPNWDNTPRSGRAGVVLHDSTPELFRAQVERAVAVMERNAVPAERRIIILKSWNEWAEGNYIEPDREHGRAYLRALRTVLRGEVTVGANSPMTWPSE